MTIATQINKVLYAGDGVQTVFPYTFKVFSSSDLVVIRRAVDGSETPLKLYTDFTVSGVGSGSGGNVTLLGAQASSPPAAGEKLLVKRVVPLTQNSDWVENNPFPAAVIENAVDRAMCIAQQQQEVLDRCLKVGETSSLSGTIDPDQIAANATASQANAAAAAASATQAAASAASIAFTLDTDTALAANSDARVASQRAVKAYADTKASASAVAALILGHGQCRLTKAGSDLLLSRDGPGFLVINGVTYVVPSAGVPLAPTGKTPNTLYYIYAYMNGANMALEASTTGHSQDATTGVEIKTGDASRTLVGMARCVTGPAWADTAQQRLVSSYFNRRTIGAQNKFAANRATSSATVVELSSSERAEFLTWPDEDVLLSAAMAGGNSVTGSSYAYVTVDGTTPIEGGHALFYQTGGTGWNPLSIPSFPARLAEGYHYAAICAKTSTGGSLTILGGSTAGERATVQAVVRG